MTVLGVVLPLVGIVVGAGITYWLNVRARRRTYIEDLFSQAIGAVAAAEVSIDYLASVSAPRHLSTDEHEELHKFFVTEGLKHWRAKVIEANDALARVVPYRPEIRELLPFSPDDTHRGTNTAVIEVLKRGPVRASTRGHG